METLHSVGEAITFITLFQQIYTIVIESILSRSCTKSVNDNNAVCLRHKKHIALNAIFYLQWNFFLTMTSQIESSTCQNIVRCTKMSKKEGKTA